MGFPPPADSSTVNQRLRRMVSAHEEQITWKQVPLAGGGTNVRPTADRDAILQQMLGGDQGLPVYDDLA
jgi:hypothetical protein